MIILDLAGFLCTGDSVITCNNGMRDQVLALKWVQRNILHFGGNPDRVTIGGNSAGASAVHMHVLSPMSKGLHPIQDQCCSWLEIVITLP